MLVKEALEGLAVYRDGWYVDGTYGRGGHTSEILAALGERGRLLALDKDPEAVEHAHANFGGDPRFSVRFGGFENFRALVAPWLCEQPARRCALRPGNLLRATGRCGTGLQFFP